MAKETKFREWFLGQVRRIPGVKALPIENMVGAPGVSDVFIAARGQAAWIELKDLDAFPKRGGVVRINHFTSDQRIFLLEMGEIGIGSFLLVRVGTNQYYLFDHLQAGEVYEGRDVSWWNSNGLVGAPVINTILRRIFK